jgi:hypothetical protein
MPDTTPTARDVAKKLLEQELRRVDLEEFVAVQRALDRLRAHMTVLVGAIGVQALLSRALAMTKRARDWLDPVRLRPDGALEGFSEAARDQDEATRAEGMREFLSQLLALLVAFVGEDYTRQLVRDAWSAAADDANPNGTERPE